MSSISGSGSGGSGGVGILSLTGNTGGALIGSNINIVGGTTGLVFNGAGTTLTLAGTLVVSNGGTGLATATAYAPLVGGTTGTGPFQSASSGQGTAGFVFTSTGSSSVPTWQAIPTVSAIATINGDSGSATGSTVTFSALGDTKAGATWKFTGSGSSQILTSLDSSGNLFIGTGVSLNITPGNVTQSVAIGGHAADSLSGAGSIANVFIGYNAGLNATTSLYNTAIGWGALQSFGTSGLGADQNVAIGQSCLYQLTAGVQNVGVGAGAGTNYTGAESQNIIVGGSYGILGESNKTRIGFFLNAASQTGCFIDGITGVTVTGAAVLVSTAGQLGVAVSSAKYKENIQDMADFSSRALNLRPVTFSYKGGSETRFGLIAEEVNEVLPEIVVYDPKGKPQTVMYHELPALLLNELQKALKRIEALEARS